MSILMHNYFIFKLNNKQIKNIQTVIQRVFICLFYSFVPYRFLDPLTRGDYPQSMRSLVKSRLPKFTKEQSKLLINSFDFLGLNYYTANYVSDAPELRNVQGSYVTDALVNYSCKQACLITYIFIC